MNEEELSKSNNSDKNKKEPIFFNSGLVYKSPVSSTNQKNERKFEEKSENYPTIMEHKSNTNLADYEKKNPLLAHNHERPKSTNPEQKKELVEENHPDFSNPKQIFKENDEKTTVKNESPGRKIDFNIHGHKDKEKPHKEPILLTFKEVKSQETSKNPNQSNNYGNNNNNSSNNRKLDSLKERLNFINSQCQEIISHLNEENNKYFIIK